MSISKPLTDQERQHQVLGYCNSLKTSVENKSFSDDLLVTLKHLTFAIIEIAKNQQNTVLQYAFPMFLFFIDSS
jgi:hypothetical protein